MILAIDIGTITGVAYGGGVQGCHSASRNFSNHTHDYALLGLRFSKWIEELIIEHKPSSLAIERPFFSSKHAEAGVLLHGLCWEANRLGRIHGISRSEYGPMEIKRFFTGSGKAQKSDMIEEAKRRGFNPANSHEADSIALLLLHESRIS